MALPQTPSDWYSYLGGILDRERNGLKALNNEYELQAERQYMQPELMAELGDRIKQVVIAWPQLVVDALEERLNPEGFRLPDADDADDDLQRVWQANNLDEESQLGRVDALVMKRSFLTVGANEDDDDTPLVSVESPLEMYAYIDPRTRKPLAALKKYVEEIDPNTKGRALYATLYLPNSTHHYDLENGVTEVGRDEHGLGAVPVVPLVNRGRLADRYGRSELTPILPLTHAANKLATDMMVAAEFVALPLRGIFGAGPGDLEDAQGNKLTAFQALMGRLLMFPGDPNLLKQFEFASANLGNFHDSINQLAKLVASLAGLPPHFLGFSTDNPASADAIRSAEARLVKRAERRMVPFGGSYEDTMRLVKRFQEGDWDPKWRRLETIWRNAATPTVAQIADYAVKLHAERIATTRQVREDVGYTDAQIRRMEAEDEAADARLLGEKPEPIREGPVEPEIVEPAA